MPRRNSTSWRWHFGLAGLLTLLSLLAYLISAEAPPFQSIEGQTLDWRFALRGPIQPGPETVLVAIDEPTLARLGRWPLDRRVLAQGLKAISDQGARVIALDLLLLEPQSPEADGMLADAVVDAGRVVMPLAFRYSDDAPESVATEALIDRAAFGTVLQPSGHGPGLESAARGLLAPVPPLDAVGHVGHVNVLLDRDGHLRFAHPALAFGTAFVPSLAVETLRLYRGVAKSDAALLLGEGLRLGAEAIETDRWLRLAINYYGPAGSFPRHSLADAIEGKLPPDALRDRIVLVGTTVLGTGDTFVTPFSQTLPGVEYFATAVDNMLHRRWLWRDAWVRGFDLLAIALGGLLAAAIVLLARPSHGLIASVGLLGAWVSVAALAFQWGDLWLNVTFPAMAILLNLGLVAVHRGFGDDRRRRQAESRSATLSRYVSPLVTAQLDRGGPAPAGTSIATVMFVDLVGFTGRSETMLPAESLKLMQDFHARVERIVAAHRGVIEKFVGDGALAIFGLPDPDPASAESALGAARALVEEVAAWGVELQAEGQPPLQVAIGLHRGPLTLGEIGGPRQSQVTVAGDTVNVASRLEALTRQHGAAILASDAVVAAARQTAESDPAAGFAPLPPQPIRGRQERLAVWAWPEPTPSEAKAP